MLQSLAPEEQTASERGGVLGSSTRPPWESWSPVVLWQGSFCSQQGEVSLGWDPNSLPSSRSEGSSASLPGLCTAWLGAQPEVAQQGPAGVR